MRLKRGHEAAHVYRICVIGGLVRTSLWLRGGARAVSVLCVSFFGSLLFSHTRERRQGCGKMEKRSAGVRRRWIGGTCGGNEAEYVEAMFPK